MARKSVLLVIISLVLLLSVVSAIWPFTGNAVKVKVPRVCTDSDSLLGTVENQVGVPGTAKMQRGEKLIGSVKNDFCIGSARRVALGKSTKVREFYCKGTLLKGKNIYCPTGTYCANNIDGIGVCVAKDVTSTGNSAVCVDSDAGKNYAVKGGVSTTEQDRCLTELNPALYPAECYSLQNGEYDLASNGKCLIEYYCDGTSKKNEVKVCEHGCVDGKCAPVSVPACSSLTSLTFSSLSPTGGVSTDVKTTGLSWTGSCAPASGVVYDVQMRVVGSTALTFSVGGLGSPAVPASAFASTSLVVGTNYEWSVRACNNYECTVQSARSSWQAFRYVPAAPEESVAVSCSFNSFSPQVGMVQDVTQTGLDWEATCGAGVVAYQYRVSKVGSPLEYVAMGIVPDSSVSASAFSTAVFVAGASYTWQVRACLNAACTSASSWTGFEIFTHPGSSGSVVTQTPAAGYERPTLGNYLTYGNTPVAWEQQLYADLAKAYDAAGTGSEWKGVSENDRHSVLPIFGFSGKKCVTGIRVWFGGSDSEYYRGNLQSIMRLAVQRTELTDLAIPASGWKSFDKANEPGQFISQWVIDTVTPVGAAYQDLAVAPVLTKYVRLGQIDANAPQSKRMMVIKDIQFKVEPSRCVATPSPAPTPAPLSCDTYALVRPSASAASSEDGTNVKSGAVDAEATFGVEGIRGTLWKAAGTNQQDSIVFALPSVRCVKEALIGFHATGTPITADSGTLKIELSQDGVTYTPVVSDWSVNLYQADISAQLTSKTFTESKAKFVRISETTARANPLAIYDIRLNVAPVISG
ncbi:MAG TPA: hypothetical protein VJK51_05525 [Candidatus Nanoarchaeia archaeon]|nr:hypothetical protein [Candidatus Nanoarchaeia archaeon]